MKHHTSPAAIAEDDSLRCAYVRKLIQQPAPPQPPIPPQTIPPVLVQFWDKPAALPNDVRDCIDSWEPLVKQGFTRQIFDEARARTFIATEFGTEHSHAFARCIHPAMQCDYFRLCYIYHQGGFYVDADEEYLGTDCSRLLAGGHLVLQPLCYDQRSGEMVAPAIFTNPQCHSDEWIYYVNNNPLIAPARHPVVGLALARATRRLLQTSPHFSGIQSTTGPGNLTASLVLHSLKSAILTAPDFQLVSNWETYSRSPWPLSYRSDERNWRLWESAQHRQHS